MKLTLLTIALALTAATAHADTKARATDYVDPRIGSLADGHVFIGPAYPYASCKPSPDCGSDSNAGWQPMPEPLKGFSQTHVSGAGGPPKYGNISIMPYTAEPDRTSRTDYRDNETIRLGYYATHLIRSQVTVETTAHRHTALYRLTYPQSGLRGLTVDAGFCLERPGSPEGQRIEGSEVRIMSDYEIEGYTRVSGGWNLGRAYTVYFHLTTDKPFTRTRTFAGGVISTASHHADDGQPAGALVEFAPGGGPVMVRIGISYVSSLKARQMALDEIPRFDFDDTRLGLTAEWEDLLSRVEIPGATDAQKRMYYTALYHTMLMPADRTGDNPLWHSAEPYYDDFYAIWDTYRTSTPLITIIDPDRQADICRALVDISRHDGYLPDGRSGNCNGRVQGGTDADIVLADGYCKHLADVDWQAALDAMLHSATTPPGGNEEAQGRGALAPYLSLGYIPYEYPRAGTRTIEYSYCDFAIAQLAKGLGRDSVYRQYLRQSASWKNLWRKDATSHGVSGFIMPRAADGTWPDSLPFGHGPEPRPTFIYTPETVERPWYRRHWDAFFYEGTSWQYSLAVPHDVPGLIELCGGYGEFAKRLDEFFDGGHYDVGNEPSFLAPCLYHWIEMPDRTADRVLDIMARCFSDRPDGLPGNDDSGAMSAWLAFHMMGLYPNAGQDYYLLHTPALPKTVIHLTSGRDFTIIARGLSDKNRYIQSALLDGEPYPYSLVLHDDLTAGGTLTLIMGEQRQRNFYFVN